MPPKKKDEEAPKTVVLGRPGTSLKMGVVGLPNVGKSSFFNIMTKQQVPAENFPFCTINPNMAKVAVPDKRFDLLSEVFKPKSEIPATLQVTDIAGLVKGAATGEGLGNAFLSHISAVDGIFHMVRVFDDDEITHVEGDINPVRDLEIIFSELIAKDLESVKFMIEKTEPLVERGIDKTKKQDLEYMRKILSVLEEGKQIRCASWTNKEIEYLNTLQLLTAKPALFLLNMSSVDFARKKNRWLVKIKEWVDAQTGELMIPFSVDFEQKLSLLEDPEKIEAYLKETGAKSMIPKIIVEGFKCINLMYFFTAGEVEVRAWAIQKGMKAPQAAGRIHSDMEHGFICVDVVHWTDFEEIRDMAQAREIGKLRQEGKQYEVQDGDVLHFKFNPPSKGGKK